MYPPTAATAYFMFPNKQKHSLNLTILFVWSIDFFLFIFFALAFAYADQWRLGTSATVAARNIKL